MFEIILYQPEIPPNTGNIIRLSANTGCRLHLIAPLGFALDDKRMRRAGLDYKEWAKIQQHNNLEECLNLLNTRCFALSSKGRTCYTEPDFQPGDAFLFGPETRGLPADVLATFDKAHLLTIPQTPQSRSLNLSNSTAIVVYEAWRQNQFAASP